jgi:tetratricopeptide (TPR) repeat protein
MKPILVLSIAAVLAASISFAVARFTAAAPVQAGSSSSVTSEDVARLARTLAESDARQAALQKTVEDLRADLALRANRDTRVPANEIEDAVSRALKQQGGSVAVESSLAADKARAQERFDAQAAMQELLDPNLTREEKLAKWKAINAAGALDEVVAMFEAFAKEHPESAGAQVDLGGAYLQKVFKAGNGPEAGVWATKADKAFDAALSIDDRSWDARFSKAVSLSFWPPVFGKQTEAIKNFEVLAEQQSQQPSDPKFAQTWLLLGNLYQQLGRADQALAAWQKGLAAFPDNASLLQQIANAQGH